VPASKNAPAPRPVVRAEGLTLGYPRHTLVRDLSFEISPGEILGIVGPNGSGKTTLLRTMLGLMKPNGGQLDVNRTLTVSYVPQRDVLDTMLPITSFEVTLMGRDARLGALQRPRQTDRDEATRALARVGVETLGRQLFRTLSGGQQQRVLLARALAADPDVLVLDEPTTGMDVASEANVIDFLRDLNRTHGVTILIVTHLLPLVLNLATSIMLVGNGGVLHGPVDEVLKEDRLTALYNVPVHLGRVAGQRTLVVGNPGGR